MRNRRPSSLHRYSCLLAFLAAGCGSQAYVVTPSTVAVTAPGSYATAPKVDILLASDDTGSMYEILSDMEEQLPDFLAGLESAGWNYHFSVTPLTSERKFEQIHTSKHDPNWGALWVEPYPGASTADADTVSSSVFTTSLDWVDLDDISNESNGTEEGLQTITNVITSEEAQSTGFLRDDALLVVIALSNGNDTSGLTYTTRSDGIVVATDADDVSTYSEAILSTKGGEGGKLRFFAAVADMTSNKKACLGANSDKGTRYQSVASDLGGESYDICTQSVTSILSAISANLTQLQIDYVTQYLFLPVEPNLDTLKVTVIDGDTGESREIPQQLANGWSYAGYLSNTAAIVEPVKMNVTSGYAIELHGDARVQGNDSATVSYEPAGTRDAASK